MSHETLTLIMAIVIAVAVLLYVALDGFDLGIGILFPFAGSDAERDTMMNSVAPFWDGNETWLVMGGGGLLAAFPVAYATILPATYLPLMLMLFALVFRGVAFELRFKAVTSRAWWDRAFSWGSTLAAFSQGIVLGTFVQGINVQDGRFAGGPFDWLTPFALMTGVALVAGYALLGATWLIFKTEGELQARARRQARIALVAVAVFVGLVSLWTPLAAEPIARRWFSFPNIVLLAPVPLASAVLMLVAWRTIGHRDHVPFFASLGIFTLAFVGLGISQWPYAVPRAITIWDAAAAPESLTVIAIGVAAILPLILAYTAYNYWVFRGKVGHGYH